MEPQGSRRSRHDRSVGFSVIELMIVVLIVGVIAAMAIPVFSSIARNLRADGDLRSISSDISLAKMRAAASFTKARLRANTTAGTFQLEVWNKTGSSWDAEGGVQSLAQGVSFGFGSLGTPPSNTQTSIGQAPACRNNANADISGTACVVFNSRGIPVDNGGSPTGEDAIYMSDGTSVQGVTISGTGLTASWRTPIATASWKRR